MHAHTAWNQKFRKSEISLDKVIQPPTLLQNVLFCPLLLTSVVQKVRVCTMDFVSASKNTLVLGYMWPFAKKLYHGWISTMTSSNEISWKLPPPEMKSWLHPCLQQHSLQLQKRSARMSLWIRAVEPRRCAPGIIGVREGISLGGRKKYVLKITIYPETNFFSRIRMKPETSCKSVLYSWMRL